MNATKAAFSPVVICRGLAGSATRLALRGPAPLMLGVQSLQRGFSTTRSRQLEYVEPAKNAPRVKLTPPQWPHPAVNEDQLKKITIAHREVRNWSDWVAYNMVRLLRWGTDLATGYRHDPSKPYVMNEKKWLIRFVFLETVAGVPGMMGGMIRHFHSLRKMKRDNGWRVHQPDKLQSSLTADG